MGPDRRNNAPFAIIISVAIFGFITIFLMFTEPVNGQYLELNNHLANVKSKINNIRFGSHSDKTRMVIDLRNPTNLAYEIYRNSKIILLKLPTARW